MRRLLMMFVVVALFLSLVPAAAAAPQGDGPTRGESSLVEAMNWALRLWEAVMESLPTPPGTTNGSCVDPDGSPCRSH